MPHRLRVVNLAFVLVLALVACGAGGADAADHPIQGDSISLRDRATNPARRRVGFQATREFAIDHLATADPRVVGASLTILGESAGDGAAGPIVLDASLWRGIGSPPGSKGYRYLNLAGTPIRKVVFKGGKRGGTLILSGGKAAWPYVIPQPQGGPIHVQLAIGDDVYCARFPIVTFTVNVPERLRARNAAPPPNCSIVIVPPACGNGALEVPEECDDGGENNGDGCSSTCQLESLNPALCAGIVPVAGTNLTTVPVASGFEAPVHLAAPRLDPSRLFVVEQAGRIQLIKNGVKQAAAFLDITGIVQDGGEQGLLSVAFHPDYETNRRFFVYYTNNGGNLEIARYQATLGNPDDADESSAHVVHTIAHLGQANHNGGNLSFGPDGFLYAATGDGGGGGDPDDNAQDDTSELGKVLRIDPATDAVTIWGKGLRNPFRFSFDRANGDIYIGDVGQGRWEEISHAAGNAAGVNYGWDDMEGRHCFEPGTGCATAGRTLPVLEYCNSNFSDAACGTFQSEKGQAVTGGFVYRGCALPGLHGRYFYSDFYTAFIRSFMGVSGGNAQSLQHHTNLEVAGNVSSFGEDARGELYIVDYDGDIFKIVPAP